MTEEKNPQIRVLVVDDQPIIREGIRALLTEVEDIQVVGVAGDGAQAVAEAQRLAPDVVLMDLVMPGMDGIEATRAINQMRVEGKEGVGQRPRVLVLTSFTGDEKVFPALKAGAMGYLLKDSRSVELVDAIRQVSRNESWLHPMIARKVLQEMQHQSEQTHGMEQLTPRETEVLRLVAQGLGNLEIAEKLFISEVTVRTHVSNILKKLHLTNTVQAALYALQKGYVSMDGPATDQ